VSFGTPLKPNIEDRGIVHIDIGSFNFEGLYRGVMGDNRQREKTPGQVVNEFEEVLDIKKERNKETQGVRTDLNDEDNFSANSQRDVADEVGCSQDTVSRLLNENEKFSEIGQPDDFELNVYDIWNYSGSDNRVGWPGEIPQDIVLWIPVTLSHGD